MRLNKEKNNKQNKKVIPKKSINHNKTSSMDNISKKSRNIYLNKILERNLGNPKLVIDKESFKDNIQNFQTSIQNIFANDERRQKAKNYVINLRNKNNAQSPYHMEEEYIIKNKNDEFSASNYGGFYNKNALQKTYEILEENAGNNLYNYRSSQKERPINMQKIFGNSPEHINNKGFIKVNKINKYNNEIRYFGDTNIYIKSNVLKAPMQKINNQSNNINNNIQLLKPSKTNIKFNNEQYPKKYNKINSYEDAYEEGFIINDPDYNQMYLNSYSDFNNNSGNEYQMEYMNDYNKENELYNEGFKYNNQVKSPNYNYNNNKNYKIMNKSKTNKNLSATTNKNTNITKK